MIDAATIQGAVVVAYVVAAILLFLHKRFPWAERVGVTVTLVAWLAHFSILLVRGLDSGEIPIVSRYEDFTVDAMFMVGVYLIAQWRWPQLRRTGIVVLPVAALIALLALKYSRGVFPMGPALRTNWLIIHATLNSLAVGFAPITLAAGLMKKQVETALVGRLLAWTFLFWSAMVATGSYWASITWGRFWGWDPIECWSLGTVIAYAFVLHIRFRPAWRQGLRGSLLGIVPFSLMMFTTYGLLMVLKSVHGAYVFQ